MSLVSSGLPLPAQVPLDALPSSLHSFLSHLSSQHQNWDKFIKPVVMSKKKANNKKGKQSTDQDDDWEAILEAERAANAANPTTAAPAPATATTSTKSTSVNPPPAPVKEEVAASKEVSLLTSVSLSPDLVLRRKRTRTMTAMMVKMAGKRRR